MRIPFQNLVVDGIAGVQTQNLAGDIVRILQYNLNLVVRPDPPLPQSYYYGSQTQAAVRRFQQLFNLPITGIASLEVRTKLNLAAQRISP
jgi:peptidoglycan hydrolase-like protein with peptidoglycan-binding domain